MIPDGAEREFVLSLNHNRNRWEIAGKGFDPRRIDVRPERGSTGLWTFRNQSSAIHPMHIHLVQFQTGRRSHMGLSPPQRYQGRYLIHCHNLAHEDHAMMAQMLVS